MKLYKFVQKYVPRNSILRIRKAIPCDDPHYTEYPILWHGMEWQTYHLDYCKKRGFEICPYRNIKKFKIMQLGDDIPVCDNIDIIITEEE